MVKILIADEHSQYRLALSEILATQNFEVSTCDTSLLETMIHPWYIPDIAIVSYKSTKPESRKHADWVRDNYPMVNVIVSCLQAQQSIIDRFKLLGVRGLYMKAGNAKGDEIFEAIKAVLAGRKYFP